MRILKIILIIIGVIIAIPLIAALFIKNEYHVERSIIIVSPRPIVMDHIKSLKKMNEWSPFMEEDPTVEVTYAGNDSEVGSSSSWKSDKSGEGTQTIESISEGQVKTHLDFKKPMENTASGTFDVIPSGPGTKVTWSMDGRNPYPFNLFILFMDGMLGPTFEKGLQNLKGLVENGAPATPAPPATN